MKRERKEGGIIGSVNGWKGVSAYGSDGRVTYLVNFSDVTPSALVTPWTRSDNRGPQSGLGDWAGWKRVEKKWPISTSSPQS